MTAFRPANVVFPLFIALSACGGSGGGNDPSLAETRARAEAAVALGETYNSQLSTFAQTIPVTGTARFSGLAGIIIDPVAATETDDLLMLGDVRLDVSFSGTGAVTGTIDNISGLTNVGTGVPEDDARVFSAPGRIAIGGVTSQIGDPAERQPRNEWLADYAGSVATPGGTYLLNGDLEGRFIGNRVNNPNTTLPMRALYGLSAAGQDAIGPNGPAAVLVEVLAEN